MTDPAVLRTDRLTLRVPEPADAPRVAELAGDRKVARTTARIPHPYEQSDAEEWIASTQAARESGEEIVFAVVVTGTGELVGACGLVIEPEHRRAELGFWVGVPYWGRGYATEAARAVVAHAFDALELDRVSAVHMADNPASGRVLEKAGMRHEGTLRGHHRKWGEVHDLECWGVLRRDRGEG